MHFQAAALAVDRGGQDFALRLAADPCRLRPRARTAPAGPFDEFQLSRDHIGGIGALDRADIGAVDHGKPQVRPAIPHRQRRRFDQPGQRVERGRQVVDLGLQPADLALAVGRVHRPQHDRARRTQFARRAAAPHGDRPSRSLRVERSHERPPGSLRRLHLIRQRRRLVGGQARAIGGQILQETRRDGETQPIDQPRRHLDPAIRAHQHGQRG